MIIAAAAPIDTCGNALAANEIHAGCTRRLVSPDGRWQVVIKGEGEPAPAVNISRQLKDDNAVVADHAGHVIAVFDMERDARLYWLKDGRHLIVNYFAGSDSTRPLAFNLNAGHSAPVDLSALVFSDVLRRIHKRRRQVYHYYMWYLRDEGDYVTFAAEPEFTIHGDYGPGDGRCLIYRVDKATFRGYRFVREAPDDKCPQTPSDGP